MFVCGYTPHYVGGSSASPGGGSGTGAAAGPQPPDTDYIVLGYNTLSGFAWGDWAHIAEPNVTGVRVWNGPGPTPNKSDDRAMDITLDGNPGVTGWRVWLTGRVREADGVGYDVATISYRILSAGASPQEVLTPFLPKATERGVAVTANGRDVYVTATIQPDESDLPLILAFKIDEDSGSYAIEWMRLFGYSISDIPSAIIAPTAADLTVPVFVAGLSYLLTTSHDQISLRYSQ